MLRPRIQETHWVEVHWMEVPLGRLLLRRTCSISERRYKTSGRPCASTDRRVGIECEGPTGRGSSLDRGRDSRNFLRKPKWHARPRWHEIWFLSVLTVKWVWPCADFFTLSLSTLQSLSRTVEPPEFRAKQAFRPRSRYCILSRLPVKKSLPPCRLALSRFRVAL